MAIGKWWEMSDETLLGDGPVAAVSDDVFLQSLQALYERGLYRQALDQGEARWGGFRQWPGVKARLLAARIGYQLGLYRTAHSLVLRLWRRHRDDAQVRYAFVRGIFSHRGPFIAMQWVRRFGEKLSDNPKLQSDWLVLQAMLYGAFRDWENAHALLDQAAAMPDANEIQSERAYLFELEDRYDEAIALLEQLYAHQQERYVAQQLAHLYAVAGNAEAALTLLRASFAVYESADLGMQLYNQLLECDQLEEAATCLLRVQELIPASEPYIDHNIAAARAEYFYRQGNYTEALQALAAARGSFFQAVRESLEKNIDTGKRVELDVPFIRQHHMTCAPATLTAISRYHHRHIDHLEVAEQICYDGTTALAERRWVEEQDWAVREFELNLADVIALIDAGCPVGLATVEPGSAHMQAIIGYDTRLGIYLLRDPYRHRVQEMLIEGAHEYYASTGPRCMVMVPPEKQAWLEKLPLRAAPLYDLYYHLQTALEKHDRRDALRLYGRLLAVAPDHRLTLWAKRSIASYDNDLVRQLQCVESLLALYPADLNLLVGKARMLSDLGRNKERLAFVEQCRSEGVQHPYLLQALVDELRLDSRRAGETQLLLRKILRWHPTNAEALWSLAGLHWDRQEYAQAFEYYRLCMCIEDKNEHYADSYFKAARFLRRTDEALAYLKQRVATLGLRSANPYVTCVRALDLIERTPEALQVLQEALTRHPSDGWLLTEAISFTLHSGELARAEALIDQAADYLPETVRLEKRAAIAHRRADHALELQIYQQIVQLQPSHHRAISQIADHLADRESLQAALEFIERQLEAAPHDRRLLHSKLSLVERLPAAQRCSAIATLLPQMDNDVRALSAYADALRGERQLEQAQHYLEQAVAIAPEAAWLHLQLGDVLLDRGLTEAARQTYRHVITMAVDTDNAFHRLLDSYTTFEDKREALLFIYQQLLQQVSFGNGILEYQTVARRYLADAEVGRFLAEAVEVRPDLWQSWIALAAFYRETEQFVEAERINDSAVERFPLLPRGWVERADLRRLLRNLDGAEADLRTALAINPQYITATQRLADVLELKGEADAALRAIIAGLRSAPHNAGLLGYQADLFWRMQRRDDAVATLRHALLTNPWYNWGWDRWVEWSRKLGADHAIVPFALELAQSRPENAELWKRCAEVADNADEKSALLERAHALAPNEPSYLLDRCNHLVDQGLRVEAAKLIESHYAGRDKPSNVVSYEAWLCYQNGQRDTAIAMLQALLERDPGHYSAWRLLGRWQEEAGNIEDCLRCVRQCVHLFPNAAEALSLAADKLLKYARDEHEGEYRDEAKRYLRKALLLDYSDTYTFLVLADLYLDSGELEECAELFQTLLADARNPYIRSRRLRLHLLQQQTGLALADYSELLQLEEENEWLVLQPYRWFVQQEQVAAVRSCINASMESGAISALGARAWLMALIDEQPTNRRLIKELKALRKREKILNGALTQAMVPDMLTLTQLLVVQEEFNPQLMRNPVTWAQLVERELRAARWSSVRTLAAGRWQRQENPARAVYMCAIAQWMTSRWQPGFAMLDHALALPADDWRENMAFFKQVVTWLQQPEALDRAALAVTDATQLTNIERLLLDLLNVLVALEDTGFAAGAPTFAKEVEAVYLRHAEYLGSALVTQARRRMGWALFQRAPGGVLQRLLLGTRLLTAVWSKHGVKA